MNQSFNKIVRMAIITSIAIITISCSTLPKEYVPDDKIVYLKQPYYLVPIKYDPEKASPYEFAVDPDVDSVNPGILSQTDFNKVLVPDLNLDAKIYKETKKHLLLMKDDVVYNNLKEQLNNTTVDKPAPREIAKGEKVKNYSNGVEYEYPPEPGATITFFNNNDILIIFADGRRYNYKNNGDYFEDDAKGNELYAVFAKGDSFRIKTDTIKYRRSPDQTALSGENGEIVKFITPIPQYSYRPPNKKYEYVFFVDGFTNEKPISIALIHDNSLRYDYLFESDSVMVDFKDIESVVITNTFVKSHHFFNIKTRKAEDLYSYFFPEGIRIADINKPLTYSYITPNWPEKYLGKKVGPFQIFYTKKDESLLDKLNVKKLSETNAIVRKITGINFRQDRTIVLPPDLASYRKLHAATNDETLYWYPSGFQGKDTIVMWPPSLKRYEGDEGDKYFWEKELYEILTHELTHLAVGEITGVFSPVPVWLNEGLAVYVESQYSPETKKYWDISFEGSVVYNKTLSWDDIAENSTSDYPVDSARTFYAQSYKMVGYLIAKYNINKIVSYIMSFKTPAEKINTENIRLKYKGNFKKIFGITWEDNITNFGKYCKDEKTK